MALAELYFDKKCPEKEFDVGIIFSSKIGNNKK